MSSKKKRAIKRDWKQRKEHLILDAWTLIIYKINKIAGYTIGHKIRRMPNGISKDENYFRQTIGSQQIQMRL